MRQKIVPACFTVLFVFLVMVVFSIEHRPHSFKECASCHISANTPSLARKLVGPVTQLCMTCHEKTLTEGYMHPIDVRPRQATIPSDMPLSLSGEITCATCHDIHAEYLTPYGSRTHFLRRQESGKAFCRSCHRDLAALSRGHQATLGEAHFRSQYIVTNSRQEIDAMSRNCISCHDGTFASSITIRAGTWKHGKDFMRHDQGSHPIGMDYEATRMNRGSKTDLRPMALVDRRIRFFNGKVGCGSCHDPYSTISKKLVMSDMNSKLCFSCHML
jgi:predicted CXXCH cytochrome family protein